MMDNPFLRNEMLWGEEAQEKLKAAHVILFGLGGVGSYAAECLVRSGIGTLTIVDNDTVAVSNLNRQLEALHSTVGLPKTEAAARRLRDINPSCDSTRSRRPIMPKTGISFSGRAAGMTILWTPLIWSRASWIWSRRPCVWASP